MSVVRDEKVYLSVTFLMLKRSMTAVQDCKCKKKFLLLAETASNSWFILLHVSLVVRHDSSEANYRENVINREDCGKFHPLLTFIFQNVNPQ